MTNISLNKFIKIFRKLFFRFLTFLGSIIRLLILQLNLNFYTNKHINKYGPFKMHIYFIFSNFKKIGIQKKEKKLHNNLFELVVNLACKRNIIIDVGAHIGLVTMPIANNISDIGKVYSIEASPNNFMYLSKHIKKNNFTNVKLFNCIIGSNNNQKTTFYEEKLPSGVNNLYNYSKYKSNLKKVSLEMVTLDHFCFNNDIDPDLIKMDIEGAEVDAIKGSIEILKKGKAIFILSVHPKNIVHSNNSVEDLVNIFKKYNYEFYDYELNKVSLLKNIEYIVANNDNILQIKSDI